MIYDKGKFIISIIVVVAMLLMIGYHPDPMVREWAKGVFLLATGYGIANGRQLVSPFTPSPMVVPKPDRAAELLERELAAVRRQGTPDTLDADHTDDTSGPR